MTSDEIIELAKAAGAANFYPKTQTVKADNYLVGQEFLERFAKLVAAKEREACAKLVEAFEPDDKDLAMAIRARGEL